MPPELNLSLIKNDVITGFSFSFSGSLLNHLIFLTESGWFNDQKIYESCVGSMGSYRFKRGDFLSGVPTTFAYLAEQMKMENPISGNLFDLRGARELINSATAFLELFGMI